MLVLRAAYLTGVLSAPDPVNKGVLAAAGLSEQLLSLYLPTRLTQ